MKGLSCLICRRWSFGEEVRSHSGLGSSVQILQEVSGFSCWQWSVVAKELVLLRGSSVHPLREPRLISVKELSGLGWGLAVDNGLSWQETGLTLRAGHCQTPSGLFCAGCFDCEVVSSVWECPVHEPRERIPVNWQLNDGLSPRQCKSPYSSSVNTLPMKKPVRTHFDFCRLDEREKNGKEIMFATVTDNTTYTAVTTTTSTPAATAATTTTSGLYEQIVVEANEGDEGWRAFLKVN